MADGKVIIDVILEDGQVAKGVANVDKSISGISGSAEKASLSIGKIASAIGLVALARKGFDLLKDSIGAATQRIDTFEQFERVMTSVTGSTDEANRAMKLTDEIVTGTGYSLDGAAQAVQNFVTRGATVDDATKYVEAWGDAVAFYGDGSEEQFRNVTDALATMKTKGKVDMQQLNRLFDAGIPAVDLYAQATGRSADEVQEALSNGEISAEDFIDTVSEAMMEGTNGVTNISGAAKDAGATWGSTFNNMKIAVARGVANIIESIDEMLESNGLPNMRDMIADFGIAFENVLTNLAGKIPDIVNKIREWWNALEPLQPLLIAIAQAVAIVVGAIATFGSVVTVINMVKKAIDLLNLSLLLNPWTLIAVAAVAAVMLIIAYWEPISDFFIMLWEGIKTAGLAVWDFLKAAWSSTVDFFMTIWEPIGEFFSALWDFIKAVGLAIWDAYVQKWMTIINIFMTIWEPIKEFFVNLWEGIVDVALAVWEPIKEAWSSVVEFFTDLWADVSEYFGEVWEEVAEIALMVWEPIKEGWTIVVEFFKELWEGISEFFSEIWENVKEGALIIWEPIKEGWITVVEFFKQLWEPIQEWFINHWDQIKEAISVVWEVISTIIETNLNVIKTIITTGFEIVKTVIQTVWNVIKTIITTAWDIIKTIISTALTVVKALISGDFGQMKSAIRTVMSAIKSIITSIWNAIKSIVGSVLSGISSIISSVWNSIKSIVTSVMNGIKSTISTVWNAIKSVISSVMNGIKSVITSIWNGIKSVITSVVNGIKSTVSNIFNSLKGIVTGAMNGVKNAVSNGINAALNVVKNIAGKFKDAGKNIVQSIADGIKGAISKVTDAIGDVAQKARDFLPFSPPKTGPLRDIMDVKWGETISAGINKGKNEVERAMEGLAKGAETELDVGVSGLSKIKGLSADSVIGNIGNPNTMITSIKRNKERTKDEQRMIVVKPSNVELDGREIGEITWEVVEENIDRNKNILDKFRG